MHAATAVRMAGRPTVVTAVGWAVALLAVGCVLYAALRIAQFNPTDYAAWQADWRLAAECIGRDAYPCPGMSKFPLSYLVVAWIAATFDGSDRVALTSVNLLFLTLPLLCLIPLHGVRRLWLTGWPFVLALALSPLPVFYVASGALEIQSGILSGIYIGAFAMALATPGLRVHGWLAVILVVSGFTFPLYKDTIGAVAGLAIVVLLWRQRAHLVAVWKQDGGRRALIRTAALAALPVMFAQIAGAAYSAFKYGVPLPVAYMEEAQHTAPGLAKSAEFLFGSLFSPNGGLLIFWGLPGLVALWCWRWSGWKLDRAAVMAGIAVLAISCLAFARWWAPFGWDGWGNRLLVPAALGLVVAIMISLRPVEQGAAVPVMHRHRASMVASLPLLVCSAYYVAIPYLSPVGAAMPATLWPGPHCARLQQAIPDEALANGLAFWKSGVYYNCARERMLHVPAPQYSRH